MATSTATLSFNDYKGYNQGGYSVETAGSGNGNFAGTSSYYSILKVSWSSIPGAKSMNKLSFTTTVRRYSDTTVNVTAYLSTQGFSGAWDSSKVITSSTQSVSFSTESASWWSKKEVTFTLDISGRSVSGETLYIWLGGGPMYNHFNENKNGSVTYTLNEYTVSYSANGYGTAPASQTKIYGQTLTLQPFISNQTGSGYTVSYNANGGSSTPSSHSSTTTKTQTSWNTNSSGSGTSYGSKGSYTSNSSATLYAIWSSSNNAVTLAGAIARNSSQSTYTVSYNANGGTSTPSSQTLTRTTPYTFSKWAAGSTGGTQYSAGASFTPSSNTTMYAIWNTGTTTGSVGLASAISKSNTSVDGYVVTFNANGGTCSTSSLTAKNTIKWTFNKWNTKSDGSGTSYAAGATYSTSANLTLYATWTSSTTKGSITLPTPTRTGYKFLGWATSSTATSGSTGSYTPSSSLTLYAIWTPNGTVRVWYNGEYRMALVYVYSGGKWNLTLPYIYDSSQSKWRILGG